MPRLSKKFALLLVLAMLASMFVGMGTASAASDNTALTIPNIAATTGATALGTIRIQEGSSSVNTFTAGQQITFTLPSGVSLNAGSPVFDMTGYGAAPVVNSLTTKSFTITLGARTVGNVKAYFDVLFPTVTTDGAEGDIAVDIFAPSTPISSGSVIVARAASAGTTSTVVESKTQPNKAGVEIGTVRVAENRGKAVHKAGTDTAILPDGYGQIRIIAPADVVISNANVTLVNWQQNLTFAQNFAIAGAPNADGYSEANFNVNSTAGGAVPGFASIQLFVNFDDDTVTGPLTFTIKGDNVTTQTVQVGTIGDFGVTAAAVGDVKTVYAGAAKQAINDFTLKENIQGSLLERDLKFTLPSYAHWYAEPQITKDKGGLNLNPLNAGDAITYDNNRNVKSYQVQFANTAKSAWTFKDAKIFLDADAPAGDVELKITGGGMSEALSIVVGTVVVPVSVDATATDVKIGLSDQAAGDIVITEAAAGVLKKKVDTVDYGWNKNTRTIFAWDPAELHVILPPGLQFSEMPTVAVTSGDLRVLATSVDLVGSDTILVIPIDKASTTASTITISGIKYTVYRTVPEGPVDVTLAGPALDMTENADGDYASEVVAVTNATTVTPAPGEVVNAAAFVIGSTSFTLNGNAITMDVAPYIKDGRTFLPIAYVAQALGVSPSNVIWDSVNQTVTLMKGDKVVQVKIGSQTMSVNGAPITMDVAPEISNSRTCLPIALLAQAFGSTSTWDAATQTVTIK